MCVYKGFGESSAEPPPHIALFIVSVRWIIRSVFKLMMRTHSRPEWPGCMLHTPLLMLICLYGFIYIDWYFYLHVMGTFHEAVLSSCARWQHSFPVQANPCAQFNTKLSGTRKR